MKQKCFLDSTTVFNGCCALFKKSCVTALMLEWLPVTVNFDLASFTWFTVLKQILHLIGKEIFAFTMTESKNFNSHGETYTENINEYEQVMEEQNMSVLLLARSIKM